jgi:hypothetical protein
MVGFTPGIEVDTEGYSTDRPLTLRASRALALRICPPLIIALEYNSTIVISKE